MHRRQFLNLSAATATAPLLSGCFGDSDEFPVSLKAGFPDSGFTAKSTAEDVTKGLDLTGKTILQVAPELSAGGVERTVLEVTEAIIQAGGRALLASRGGRQEAAFEALGGELFRMDAKSKNPITLKRNEGKLKRLIAREGVDLVHARSRAAFPR